MAYFIFNANLDNLEGTLYRIAENQLDFNNLNINPSNYKIIEDLQENFNLVKYGVKWPSKYNGNTITYIDQIISYTNKEQLKIYIDSVKLPIKNFLENNKNHSYINKWNDYYNQLNSLNLDTITYSLNKSLEQYFNDLGQPSLNPLQLP